MRKKYRTAIPNLLATGIILSGILLISGLAAAQELEPVTVHTVVRAESDMTLKNIHDIVGINAFYHLRALVALDEQKTIRMNRDTIYSAAVLDLTKPAYVILPETDGRYINLQIISQDHYSYATSKPGRHEITEEKVGTKFAYLIVRTFINENDPEDIATVNAIQDKLVIEGGGSGPLDIPNWDIDQMMTGREALNTLGKLGLDTSRALGMKDEVDPIDHLVVAASGWGGLPEKYSSYVMGSVPQNDGTPHSVTVKDVPVDAFWSVTIYGPDGFIHENDLGVYSFNNVTAKPNEDGSYTINFGDCGNGGNCLPISEGWNYAIRLYDPRPEILDGSWVFPDIKPVK